MKKLIAVFAVLLFAAPAFAAADWNFYGQARFATFYTSQYRSDTSVDTDLLHSLQTNSRFGANVKADKITGKVELSMRNTDATDETVRTRLLFGKWNFADNGYLLVGRDWSILDLSEISNQVYGSDNDLVGYAATGNRMSQVTLGIGGLQVSLVQPTTSNTYAANTVTNDAKYPKLEALYTIPLDNFTIKLGGGWQYLNATDNAGDTENVQSYILEALVKAKFGAFYIGGSGFWGQNTNNANWCNGGINQNGIYSNSAFKPAAQGGVDDTKSYGAGGALGLNFTDTIAFEAGGGYRADDNNQASAGVSGMWTAYGQVTYKIAPGFKITPEVGYVANQDSFTTGNTGGHDVYAGLQWRIDF
jgi:hypothetical protein